MNLINRGIFSTLRKDIKEHMENVAGVYAAYTQDANNAAEYSSQFKDEKNVLSKRLENISSNSRNILDDEYKTFHGYMKGNLSSMEKSLQTYLSEPLNDNFLSKLRLYSDFGVPMSRTEVITLLKLNGSNPFGLKTLAAVMKQTNTPYTLKYRNVEALEDDLQLIRQLTTVRYTPEAYHMVAINLMSDTSVTYLRDDGSSYQTGTKYTGQQILMDRSTLLQALNMLDRIEQAWTADITTPAIERASADQLKHMEEVNERMRAEGVSEEYMDDTSIPESTTRIEKDQTIENGKSQGRQSAEGQAKYDQVMSKYKK